ncbi:hypothetical protein T484DRAFT_1942774 [Baffinella frigidus]|nr:hypothetical protein T484DRAFT_1942774 [Cryptophyta sp. CCMP2293]
MDVAIRRKTIVRLRRKIDGERRRNVGRREQTIVGALGRKGGRALRRGARCRQIGRGERCRLMGRSAGDRRLRSRVGRKPRERFLRQSSVAGTGTWRLASASRRRRRGFSRMAVAIRRKKIVKRRLTICRKRPRNAGRRGRRGRGASRSGCRQMTWLLRSSGWRATRLSSVSSRITPGTRRVSGRQLSSRWRSRMLGKRGRSCASPASMRKTRKNRPRTEQGVWPIWRGVWPQ